MLTIKPTPQAAALLAFRHADVVISVYFPKGWYDKSHLVQLKPKRIQYRSYKKFSEVGFLEELKNADFNFHENKPNFNYDSLVNKFSELVNKHAPLKSKTLRGNHAPFMNKEFQKAIYTRSRLKNISNKTNLMKIGVNTKNNGIYVLV